MGFLTAAQTARIKAVRTRTWNRPFTVTTRVDAPGTDYYDDPASISSGAGVYSGDWVWQGQHATRGTTGGPIDTAHLLLATDILNSGSVLAPGARIIVDGIECAITVVTPYPDSGEVVIAAMRVK